MLDHPALSEGDRSFVQTLVDNSLADPARIVECLDVLGRAHELGVRIELWEVMQDRGVLGESALSSARSVADGRREDLSSPGSGLEASRDEERRLGDLAVANCLLSDTERDEALRAQGELASRGLSIPLGRILVDRGFLQRPVVEGLLYLQRVGRARSSRSAWDAFGEEDLRFGQLAFENGFVDKSALGAALREQAGLAQKGISKRIGQVLYERGAMSRDAVRSILRMQALRTGSDEIEDFDLFRSAADGERLGDLLEKNRLVARDDLDRALGLQRELGEMGIRRPLGQLLLDLGVLDRDALEAALEVQAARREPGGARLAPATPDPGAASPVVPFAGGLALLAIALLVYLFVDQGLGSSESRSPEAAEAVEDVIAGGQTDHRRLIDSAERRIDNHQYAQAIGLLERLLPEVRVPEWSRRAARELETARVLDRVLDELAARIDERPVQVVDLGGGPREIVSASAEGLTVRRPGEAGDRSIPWPNVGPEAFARLLDAYEVADQNPEGVLRFFLEHGLEQRADRLAVSILRRSPDRREAVLTLIGAYRDIRDPVESLEIVDGRLVPRGR